GRGLAPRSPRNRPARPEPVEGRARTLMVRQAHHQRVGLVQHVPAHFAAINIRSIASYSCTETARWRLLFDAPGCRKPVSVLCAMTISSFGTAVMNCPPTPQAVNAPFNGSDALIASYTHQRRPYPQRSAIGGDPSNSGFMSRYGVTSSVTR